MRILRLIDIALVILLFAAIVTAFLLPASWYAILLVALAAVGLAVLTAGMWYARRRWLG